MNRPCEVPECGRSLHTKTLCNSHYKRLVKGLPVDVQLREWKHISAPRLEPEPVTLAQLVQEAERNPICAVLHALVDSHGIMMKLHASNAVDLHYRPRRSKHCPHWNA